MITYSIVCETGKVYKTGLEDYERAKAYAAIVGGETFKGVIIYAINKNQPEKRKKILEIDKWGFIVKNPQNIENITETFIPTKAA